MTHNSIAIVGAGYAGLAVAWHCIQKGIKVALFDAHGIGTGASLASTGLYHPYPAKDARRSVRADEAMAATDALLEVAAQEIGKPVSSACGVLRLAVQPEQVDQFQERADQDAFWVDPGELGAYCSGIRAKGGLWIPRGKVVFSSLYLQGLWLLLKKKGADLHVQNIEHISQLDSYRAVVLATGASLLQFPECSHLPLKIKYGQSMLCKWPESLEPLSCALIGDGHISPTQDPCYCVVGSTYEHGKYDPDALKHLEKKIANFFTYPLPSIQVKQGIRISPKVGYLPGIWALSSRLYAFAGLGSRGLLYHALYAKELVDLYLKELYTRHD